MQVIELSQKTLTDPWSALRSDMIVNWNFIADLACVFSRQFFQQRCRFCHIQLWSNNRTDLDALCLYYGDQFIDIGDIQPIWRVWDFAYTSFFAQPLDRFSIDFTSRNGCVNSILLLKFSLIELNLDKNYSNTPWTRFRPINCKLINSFAKFSAVVDTQIIQRYVKASPQQRTDYHRGFFGRTYNARWRHQQFRSGNCRMPGCTRCVHRLIGAHFSGKRKRNAIFFGHKSKISYHRCSLAYGV